MCVIINPADLILKYTQLSGVVSILVDSKTVHHLTLNRSQAEKIRKYTKNSSSNVIWRLQVINKDMANILFENNYRYWDQCEKTNSECTRTNNPKC